MLAKRLFDEIDKTDIVKILSDLVNIPSYDTEKGIVEYLARRFDNLGVKYEFTDVALDRQNIIAEIGTGNKSLIFNSHTDTVPPGNDWSVPPLKLTRNGNKLYGLGSCDAKASLASMLCAYELLARDQSALNGRLIFQAVCCEETRARGTLAETARGIKADAAIIGEPTQLIPMIGHKGGLVLEIISTGKSVHASAPDEGINAISNISRLVCGLNALADDISKRCDPLLGNPSLAVTMINGGKATNVIPDKCSIIIDRRLIPGETIKKALDEILLIIEEEKKSNPSLSVSMEEKIGIEPCIISKEEPIVKAVLDSIFQVTGEHRKPTGFTACCDMWCLVQKLGIPTLIFGPGKLSMAHKIDENVSINELYESVKIYTAIALNWLL